MAHGRPPPPPPQAPSGAAGARRPLPAPTGARPAIVAPAPGQSLSQASKDAIAESALGLLEEQVEARIVHYKADLETNPELDAITAQVVAQLRQMQDRLAAPPPASGEQRAAIAEQQERALTGLLERLFRAGAPTLAIEKKLKTVLRNLARLFFQSELHERTRGVDGTTKVIQHGEQAIYYLLTRYHHRMKNELENFEYVSEEIRERSSELLEKLTKDMQDAFLARRSTELKRIVGVFGNVLVDFVSRDLPPMIPALSREVVQAASKVEGKAYGYKIGRHAFGPFRTAFERGMMTRLVSFAEDALVTRLADTAGASREETLKFITNPELFTMIVSELEAGTYEHLFNEGFLDLPPEWIEGAASGR